MDDIEFGSEQDNAEVARRLLASPSYLPGRTDRGNYRKALEIIAGKEAVVDEGL